MKKCLIKTITDTACVLEHLFKNNMLEGKQDIKIFQSQIILQISQKQPINMICLK